MISQLLSACESIAGFAIRKGNGPATRISRIGMPNGFFLNDLLWFGDGATKRTAVYRGFMIEPGEMTAFSVGQLNDLHERLRVLLGMLGEEYQLQVQWSIDSDYRHELEEYHRETLELRRRDPVYGQFGVLVRAERYERYKAAMQEGRLRRERLTLFFTRVIDTKVPAFGQLAIAEYFDTLSRKETLGLQEFVLSALSRLFPDCRITPIRDEDHFLFYYRFLNTNLGMTEADPLEVFDPSFGVRPTQIIKHLRKPQEKVLPERLPKGSAKVAALSRPSEPTVATPTCRSSRRYCQFWDAARCRPRPSVLPRARTPNAIRAVCEPALNVHKSAHRTVALRTADCHIHASNSMHARKTSADFPGALRSVGKIQRLVR